MKAKFPGCTMIVISMSFLVTWMAISIVDLRAETMINFQTEDGWRIDGSLFLPDPLPETPLPVVVLLTEPGWIDRTTFSGHMTDRMTELGIAALAIDFRGMGSSLGKKDFVSFSEKELEGLRLDIKGAIKFLSTQKGIDLSRIALLGTGLSSHYAALEAAENQAIKALVILSPVLNEESKKVIERRSEMPVLSIAGKEDKKRFQIAAEVFGNSRNKDSDFIIATGRGTSMFSHTRGLEDEVAAWVDQTLKGLGAEREVSFQSKDGWTIRGHLRIPPGARRGESAPGVVMVHGAKHDQQTYYELASDLTKEGIATLRFDWRGKGRSIVAGKGLYGINMPNAESENIYLDVDAAIEFLTSQPEVDGNRIGLIAATAGTGHALRASYEDKRIETVVLLTSNRAPTGEAKDFLTNGGKPIFAIASLEDINYERGSLAEETRKAYSYSSSKASQLLLYDDAGRGSEMLKTKPELGRMVLRWFVQWLKPANQQVPGGSSKNSVAGR